MGDQIPLLISSIPRRALHVRSSSRLNPRSPASYTLYSVSTKNARRTPHQTNSRLLGNLLQVARPSLLSPSLVDCWSNHHMASTHLSGHLAVAMSVAGSLIPTFAPVQINIHRCFAWTPLFIAPTQGHYPDPWGLGPGPVCMGKKFQTSVKSSLS